VTFDPFETVPLGRTGLGVTRLGFGSATIGGLFRDVAEADAVETVRHAQLAGVRYFDSAPLYGYGASERRVGKALASVPRDSFVLSTKVGRLIVPRERITADMDVDHQRIDGQDDYYYRSDLNVRPVFDYSHDGILRSVDESLGRLGLDRIDILYLHDPDHHWQQAIDGAYPALERLRAEGTVRAIGVGMNQVPMLTRFARETDVDVLLAANRYTLMDQSAAAELFPICEARGIAVVLGGVFNSGVLADPRPGSRFGYLPADDHVLDRVHRFRTVCERHGVPLRAAAIRFSLAHPAVTSMLAGVRTAAQFDDYPELMRMPIPPVLWDDLKSEGLLQPDAVTPGGVINRAAATAAPPED
jgi:D-threo-aldose 1-dehydrogenase